MTYREKLIAFGLNIAYYRKLRRFTQEKLAEISNISVSTIQKLENSNLYTGASLEMICKLASALQVTESDLLDFRTAPK